MDHLTPDQRSQNMSRIQSKNTRPEKRVRSALHKMGYRFRIHRKDLPGSPDIVLPKFETVILVHGCYWHRHEGCSNATTPKTNKAFWQEKFQNNIDRDLKNTDKLKGLGWNVKVIWECETIDQAALERKLQSFFKNSLKKHDKKELLCNIP